MNPREDTRFWREDTRFWDNVATHAITYAHENQPLRDKIDKLEKKIEFLDNEFDSIARQRDASRS